MKRFISAALGAGMMLAAAVPAFAVDPLCTNDTTGPHSDNTCNQLLKKKARVNISNWSYVKQKAHVDVNTGGNESNKNTLGGTTTTGVADGSSIQTSDVNTAIVGLDQSDPASPPAVGINSITGPHSTNYIDQTTRKKVSVNVDNDATVKQKSYLWVNSGNNESNKNTTGGEINTGNATATVLHDAVVNWTQVTITQ